METYENLIEGKKGEDNSLALEDQLSWRLSGDTLLKIVRDMVMENGRSSL
jgi:hypothetical protein